MTLRIWLGSLAAYNEGRLVGEWLELPMPAEVLTEKINQYSNNGQGDYFLADWESDVIDVSEHSNPIKLNERAEQLDGLNEYDLKRVAYLIQDGQEFDDAMEHYEDVTFYEGQTLVEVAESMVDEGLFGEIPAAIENYIDCEAIARDLRFDGYEQTSEGVYHYVG